MQGERPGDGNGQPNVGQAIDEQMGGSWGGGDAALPRDIISISASLEENCIRGNISREKLNSSLLQYWRILIPRLRKGDISLDQARMLLLNFQRASERGINGWAIEKAIEAKPVYMKPGFGRGRGQGGGAPYFD